MSPNAGKKKEEIFDHLDEYTGDYSIQQVSGEPEMGRFELDTLADIFETQTSEPQTALPDMDNFNQQLEQGGTNASDTVNWEELDELLHESESSSSKKATASSQLPRQSQPSPHVTSALPADGLTQPTPTEDDFSDLLSVSPSPRSLDSHDSTLSLDLSDLFGDDFSFEEGRAEAETPRIQPQSSIIVEKDLNELLSRRDTNTPQQVTPQHTNALPEKRSIEAQSEDDFAELFSSTSNTIEPPATIREQENSSQPQIPGTKQPQTPEQSALKVKPLEYFEQFDELVALLSESIEQVQSELQAQPDWSELSALLELPPQSVDSPRPTARKSAAQNKPAAAEEEFTDLEQLLQEIPADKGRIATSPTPAQQPRLAKRRASKIRIFEQTLKVPVKQLDDVSNLVGELVVNRNGLEQDQDQLRQSLDNLLQQVGQLSDLGARMQDLYERTLLERSLLASRYSYQQAGMGGTASDQNEQGSPDYDPLEMDSFTGFHLLSQEMIEMIVRVKESASDIGLLVDESDQVTRNLRQTTTKLQDGLKNARMVPFARTADRLPVAVRRIAQKLNKQAVVQIEGRETLIDKMILEHLSDPMTHLVNNALYHGIESPELRIAGGKNPLGQIKIAAFYQGNQTVITVTDDGAGIDPQKVKAKALAKGLISTARTRNIPDVEVYELLFHPGFSMKDKADDFAGRGVGMDVVRTSISEIRGTVSVDSALGKGTTFTIRLPLTLSICPALFCLSDKARIAFPMDGVEDTQDFSMEQVQTNDQGEQCIVWRDNVLPFKPLSELLNYNRQIGRGIVYGGQQEEDLISIVVLRSAGNFLAVQVDQVLEQQEIVIKQLNDGPVPSPAGIAGATILGDGSIMAIADVLELIEIAQGRMRKDSGNNLWEQMPAAREVEESTSTEPMVLIVDDSITVRELLKTTFSNAGYRVEQARDGQEAWEKLRSGLPCDIVFCDIEMPRMDGLELLDRMNKDEHLRELPIAMLTSRGAERHKRVAAERGASGYFTKPYTEQELLNAAQRMMAGEVLLANSSRKAKVTQTVAPPVAQQLEVPASANRQPIVLIVDDSVTVRELLAITFQKAGYQVQQARDGQEAWDKLTSQEHFDLVLCDIEMPRMDGLTLLSQIQQDEQLSQIPVAMLTSRGAQKHRQMAAERGAKGYFTKPYTEQELLQSVQELRQGKVLLEWEG